VQIIRYCQYLKALYYVHYICFTVSTAGIWVVNIINEGIGSKLGITGLHFVTTRATNMTFNIYNFYTGRHLLVWEIHSIKGSGQLGPLIFLEVDGSSQGRLGILWMHHPDHLATQFRESLDRLVVY